MDKERIRRAAMGGNNAATAQRRLFFYSVVLIAAVIYFVVYGGGDEPEQATAPLPPPQQPKQAESLAKIDKDLLVGVRDRTRDDRALLESAPFEHLLEQSGLLVYGDLEQFGLERGDWIELTAAAEQRRGDPVYVIGTLKWLEPLSDSHGYRVRAEIEDEDGRAWNAIFVTEPFELIPGDVVKAAGFFFKHYDMLRPDRSTSSGPLIVGEELLRSAFRIDPVTELREDLFVRVRDYDLGEASRPIDTPEFFELLSYVSNAPEEELFPPDIDLVEYSAIELLTHTGRYRGERMRVSGLLAYAEQVPLGPRGENPLGIPHVWKLWLSSYSGISLVFTFEDASDFVARKDVIDADGIYFRRYGYENQRGHAQMAAVVIARKVERYVHPGHPISPLLIWIILGVITIGGVAMWLGSRRDRASEIVARLKRIARQKKLTSLPGRLGGPAPGAAPPVKRGPPGGAPSAPGVADGPAQDPSKAPPPAQPPPGIPK